MVGGPTHTCCAPLFIDNRSVVFVCALQKKCGGRTDGQLVHHEISEASKATNSEHHVAITNQNTNCIIS